MIRPFFAFIALAAATLTASAGALPNIVILYADDMGYGDRGIQNPDSNIPTPSRYALLTGRYHWRDFHNIVGPLRNP